MGLPLLFRSSPRSCLRLTTANTPLAPGRYQAFKFNLASQNPLAVRCVFDVLASGGDTADPVKAQSLLDGWAVGGGMADGENLAQTDFLPSLLRAKAVSISSLVAFLGIIGLTADIIYEEAVLAGIWV